ncbi:MAG: ribose 5-phosphate isomerase B [Candidatus Brocadia sp. AMX2]|uniref:Ribose 5-phosphate isomerase B n=1 Tax=Candidatus Brocadia sinica JPN1 TaxID=1197129 RepID=A0ABQ0K0T5_9BACT|nr:MULTISPECIES: ribose 5-phosphate isomerase B [Brocadia]KXK29158.1 MAG: ribose 5-phosphate isomerase B [Candidatus Brocadia sinica]MBC6934094.1 ribose 5-phosphate isomerase B [Candidatus Brocadia sp.]MBL1170563.1 ribose 5-phosphate isomerase B [Candidatus Brocadia sp. AMX1]NOG42466.1 ribose 5-phosphate isomerase B [Planctomycetota bacterium]KAA0242390.1 MAG: ribose 5-phosphate isomerase B [Candidatus Brocadia sp. AMX2]
MRIAIGSDHAGFELKEYLTAFLRRQGYHVVDLGTYNRDPVDYPDFAEAVGLAIHNGQADRGVLICCSGVGASVAATKIPGIRAGLCHDTYSAHQGVEHDDMNILVLGSCVAGLELAKELVRVFVGAEFTGEERHRRRLEKIKALETRYSHLTAQCEKRE